VERAVLRRLAVFVGHFTVDAALEVVTSPRIDQALIFSALDGLVAKSMVAVRPAGAMVRYRLLDTTRAYALQTDLDEVEHAELAAQHAAYYTRWLEETGAEWTTLSSAAQRAQHLAGIANVSSALQWCFGSDGNAQIGVRLVAAAAPVFLAMSLLTECHRWSERAIGALDESTRGQREEMHLQAALGVSLTFTRGGRDAARLALERSLALTEQHGDALDLIQVLGPLQMFHLRTGAFKTALHYSERCSVVATKLEDSASAHSLMGISLHLSGELERARVELEAALRDGSRSRRTTAIYLGFDGRILAGAILARTLWLQGDPEQAAARARTTVEDAAGMDHSLTLSIALIWAVSVFLWAGDLESAEQHIDRLFSRAEPHALGPYMTVGRGFKAELDIRRGDAKAGIGNLQACLQELHAAPYELLSTPLNIALIQGFVADGRLADALALSEEAIQSVETNGDLCYLPELLRLRGTLSLSTTHADIGAAETYFMRSLALSRRQGARAWELRAAIDLAELLAAHGQRESARDLLQPILAQFKDHEGTTDLRSAARLLTTLS
jgi:predicted ATPase